MALSFAKQLLDELMGRDRDLGSEGKKNDFTWDGPDVCKHFLVKFCPNDLFVNTKADLGVCTKIHDERLKKEYEKSSRFEKMGYEEDFLRFCQSMLSDVDKRIKRARHRLSLSSKESNVTQPPQIKNNDERVNVLTERINELLKQIEELGCQGKVEEAQGIVKLCDKLNEERDALRNATESNHWFQTAEIAAAQEKQMEVCEVCGAFLIVGDAQQRVDDHLMGKQHVGYARLKEAVDEILANREKERTDREKLRDERDDRRRSSRDEDKGKNEGSDLRRNVDVNGRSVKIDPGGEVVAGIVVIAGILVEVEVKTGILIVRVKIRSDHVGEVGAQNAKEFAHALVIVDIIQDDQDLTLVNIGEKRIEEISLIRIKIENIENLLMKMVNHQKGHLNQKSVLKRVTPQVCKKIGIKAR
ncbi:luc7-like protein 3 [Trichonephila clavata]|uniref:Luc7-like protein 3 n=1 Tax=Trichonephila clavata TaxID=2740835 RepID=A0A8X6KVW6_TRICU|nr:luc7-like protein 3 [Trichonephila clavata]